MARRRIWTLNDADLVGADLSRIYVVLDSEDWCSSEKWSLRKLIDLVCSECSPALASWSIVVQWTAEVVTHEPRNSWHPVVEWVAAVSHGDTYLAPWIADIEWEAAATYGDVYDVSWDIGVEWVASVSFGHFEEVSWHPVVEWVAGIETNRSIDATWEGVLFWTADVSVSPPGDATTWHPVVDWVADISVTPAGGATWHPVVDWTADVSVSPPGGSAWHPVVTWTADSIISSPSGYTSPAVWHIDVQWSTTGTTDPPSICGGNCAELMPDVLHIQVALWSGDGTGGCAGCYKYNGDFTLTKDGFYDCSWSSPIIPACIGYYDTVYQLIRESADTWGIRLVYYDGISPPGTYGGIIQGGVVGDLYDCSLPVSITSFSTAAPETQCYVADAPVIIVSS